MRPETILLVIGTACFTSAGFLAGIVYQRILDAHRKRHAVRALLHKNRN